MQPDILDVEQAHLYNAIVTNYQRASCDVFFTNSSTILWRPYDLDIVLACLSKGTT